LDGQEGAHPFVINDSWEAGSQNWTDDMIAKFKKLRGYDPSPWLPVLTGRIVGSAAEIAIGSSGIFARPFGDLIANEHYGTLEEVLHEQQHDSLRRIARVRPVLVADGMEVKKFNEVPIECHVDATPRGDGPACEHRRQFGYNTPMIASQPGPNLWADRMSRLRSMTADRGAMGIGHLHADSQTRTGISQRHQPYRVVTSRPTSPWSIRRPA